MSPSPGPTFEVVVAVDDERGIGKAGDLPWRVPADMAHFKRVTLEAPEGRRNAAIMGRATWASIPERFRPLSGRYNIVLSRQPALELPDGVDRAGDLDAALALAQKAHVWKVFVIGGASIYAQALAHPACARLSITRVSGRHVCDTFFPDWKHRFEREGELEQGESGGYTYRIETWARKAQS